MNGARIGRVTGGGLRVAWRLVNKMPFPLHSHLTNFPALWEGIQNLSSVLETVIYMHCV